MSDYERNLLGKVPLIQLRAASKVYQNGKIGTVKALNPISLNIYPGELVSVIGPSGCGKTTLLKLVAGFIQCTTGKILVNGQAVEGPSPNRTMIFQDHNLFPWKTLMQNVEFGLKAQGLKPKQRIEIAQEYIDMIQLNGFEDKMPHQLSVGMRQRVAIARALVIKPTCILMDEPFGSLDTQLRNQLQDQLLSIALSEKHTILFVTHDIEEAIYLSDRIVLLSQRPARVCQVIQVRLSWPRQADVKQTAPFQELKSYILTQFAICH